MANQIVTQNGVANFSQEQIKWAFTEVSDSAFNAKKLINEAICGSLDDPEAQAALLCGARSLIEQMGWIADHHMGEPGGAPEWMLSPAYHKAAGVTREA